MKTKTGWQYLIDLSVVCHFTSRERGGLASNSELKRWLQNSVLKINNNIIKWDGYIPYPDEIECVTLFSKKNKITIV